MTHLGRASAEEWVKTRTCSRSIYYILFGTDDPLGLPLGGALRRALLRMDESSLPLHKCSVLMGVAPTAEER